MITPIFIPGGSDYGSMTSKGFLATLAIVALMVWLVIRSFMYPSSYLVMKNETTGNYFVREKLGWFSYIDFTEESEESARAYVAANNHSKVHEVKLQVIERVTTNANGNVTETFWHSEP